MGYWALAATEGADESVWGSLADWVGVAGFALALVLAMRQRPALAMTITALGSLAPGSTVHQPRGLVVTIYNVGMVPAPIARLSAVLPSDEGNDKSLFPLPGTARVPGVAPDPHNTTNPRLPCSIEPGQALTWEADAAWVRKAATADSTVVVLLTWFSSRWWWNDRLRRLRRFSRQGSLRERHIKRTVEVFPDVQ